MAIGALVWSLLALFVLVTPDGALVPVLIVVGLLVVGVPANASTRISTSSTPIDSPLQTPNLTSSHGPHGVHLHAGGAVVNPSTEADHACTMSISGETAANASVPTRQESPEQWSVTANTCGSYTDVVKALAGAENRCTHDGSPPFCRNCNLWQYQWL